MTTKNITPEAAYEAAVAKIKATLKAVTALAYVANAANARTKTLQQCADIVRKDYPDVDEILKLPEVKR